MVAGDDIALFIYCQAAVSVSVIGEAHVQLIVHNEFLQVLDVGGSAVGVDVVAIGRIIHHEGLGAQGFEDTLGNLPCRAVGYVQTDLDSLEAVFAHADQVTDVTVPAVHIVHSSADVTAAGDGDINLAVDEFLDFKNRFFVHLLAAAVEQLDAIVIIGIVGRGDHDTAVEIIHPGDVSNRRCGGHVHDICVRAAGHEAGAEGIFEHIAGTAGVLADDDVGFFPFSGAIVPAQKAADFDRVIICQILIRFSAETVCSEIFTHYLSSL